MVQGGIGLDNQVRRKNAQSLSAHLNLASRFFSRAVEDSAVLVTDSGRQLQDQRRLADAWITAEQDQYPWDDTAAEDAVQFANARFHAGHVFHGDIRQGCRLGRRAAAGHALGSLRRFRLDRLFCHGIPFTALRAAAEPAAGNTAAVRADITGLTLCHTCSLLRRKDEFLLVQTVDVDRIAVLDVTAEEHFGNRVFDEFLDGPLQGRAP